MATIKFAKVYKDQLFYDRWQYCVSFELREANALKILHHDTIDDAIARRRQWYHDVAQRWTNHMGGLIQNSVLNKPFKVVRISKTTIANLHAVADTLLQTSDEFKIITSVHEIRVYTDSIGLIETIRNQHASDSMRFTEVVINRPKNTVRLKRSRFSHRSYFKSVKLNDVDKDNLANFLLNQQDAIRLSPGLADWLVHRKFAHYTYDTYFIDHNGTNHLLMVALICPGLIRKTLPIVRS